MLTKNDWKKFFKSKKEMMKYDMSAAKDEFDDEIINCENIWEVANKLDDEKMDCYCEWE